MSNLLKEFWSHTKTFFFTVGLIFILVGFFLTRIKGFGEEVFIQFRPGIGIKVTATQALGYLLTGIGLVSWMAVVGSFVVASKER